MPVIRLNDITKQSFPNGATYQTLVGDDEGSTPVRVGVQVSPPGYSTGTHSHPYMEVVSVIEGEGEAWIEGQDGLVAIGPGVTMVFPPNVKHGFRATGSVDLKTHGVHASAHRIVDRFPEDGS
ncbi:MAG: cupin domain-containing protein [Rhodospirillaceae bacterium]|jgi:mannose-6-phosphate isomerase-like protein (cupin superfamily)|nr:cupin domain-containing protein [Rhodospirillaceae bacterium]MBT5663767.1 cupin domain-containing protein [Rhodospirillaceae bacterium]MBT5809924.1 cupin domain-containing protein [Rhodospirillaceae bacterium]